MSQITKPVILDETGQSIATQVEAVVTALENLDTFSGNYADLEGLPTLGTASALDVAASGNASSSQVVKGNDTRLTDARPSSDVVQTYSASSQVPISGKGVAEAIETVVPTKEVESATGTQYVEFSDGADAPLVKCVTAIQGNQDLHGYDKPWVGGAGKNKLEVTAVSQTINGVVFTVNSNGTVIVNGTATAETDFMLCGTISLSGSYIVNGTPQGGSTETFYIAVQTSNSSWNNRETGSGLSITNDTILRVAITVRNGYTANNLVFHPMIRLSTETDPTFAPYSNICSITAYTEGEIEVVGKNIFNDSIATVNGYIDDNGDLITGYSYKTTDYISIDPSTNYVCSGNANRNYLSVCAEYDANKNFIRRNTFEYDVVNAFTTSANAKYLRISGNKTNFPSGIQLEKGETATDYEPYVGTTHTATFSQSIYQGNADFVGGEVECDMPVIDLGDLTWTARYTGTNKKALSVTPPQNYKKPFDGICENYEVIGSVTTGSYFQNPDSLDYGFYYFQNAEYPDSYSFYVVIGVNDTPDGLCAYELNTPTTSSITPTNLPIKSLFGYNHIESSTGDMEIEYITKGMQPLVDLIEEGNPNQFSKTIHVTGLGSISIGGDMKYNQSIIVTYYLTYKYDDTNYCAYDSYFGRSSYGSGIWGYGRNIVFGLTNATSQQYTKGEHLHVGLSSNYGEPLKIGVWCNQSDTSHISNVEGLIKVEIDRDYLTIQ